MKCFYHGVDLDGQCSGAIVFHEYPECEMIPMTYGNRFPFDEIDEDEKILIVDFSLEPEQMKQLEAIVTLNNIVWIDHHKTAMEKLSDFDHLEGMRKDGTAACELTWMWFHKDKPLPEAVKYLADHDVWTRKYDPYTEYFQNGMQAEFTDPKSLVWIPLLRDNDKDYVQEIYDKGMVITTYKNSVSQRLVANGYHKGWAPKVDDRRKKYDCFFMNAPSDSMAMHKVLDTKNPLRGPYDISVMWTYDGELNIFRVSLRSDKYDVAKIAKSFGGGGHKAAAGFECKALPFPPLYFGMAHYEECERESNKRLEKIKELELVKEELEKKLRDLG